MTALVFDNRFVRELPGDPERSPRRRQVVHGACWSAVMPSHAVAAPRCWRTSRRSPELIGLSTRRSRVPRICRGVRRQPLLEGMEPYAACYGGHQFGNWAGQLGDGRAITLGEVIDAARRALGAAAQGRRRRRRTRGAPTAAPCCARRCASSCAARRCITSACRPRARCRLVATGEHGGARHVLRRQPAARARRHRVPRGAVVPALRQLRDPRRARRPTLLRTARRLHDRRDFPAPGTIDAYDAPSWHGSTRSRGAPRAWSSSGCASASCTA